MLEITVRNKDNIQKKKLNPVLKKQLAFKHIKVMPKKEGISKESLELLSSEINAMIDSFEISLFK